MICYLMHRMLFVCVCVHMRVRVCVCVCVCIYAWISASTRSILTGQVSFSLFFCVIAGQKSVFRLGRCVFVSFQIFDFLKIYFLFFLFFLMIGSRYFNWMGSIRKRIKILIFSTKRIVQLSRFFCFQRKHVFFFFLKSL